MQTSQICAWPGPNIVRATSLEVLQMSHTEFLVVSMGLIHWGAVAVKEFVLVPGVPTKGQSCVTVEVKGWLSRK